MIVTWEEPDVRAGRRIGKPGIAERQIIGYVFAEPGQQHTPTTTSLGDGLTMIFDSNAQLTAWLNDGGYQPEELL